MVSGFSTIGAEEEVGEVTLGAGDWAGGGEFTGGELTGGELTAKVEAIEEPGVEGEKGKLVPKLVPMLAP